VDQFIILSAAKDLFLVKSTCAPHARGENFTQRPRRSSPRPVRFKTCAFLCVLCGKELL